VWIIQRSTSYSLARAHDNCPVTFDTCVLFKTPPFQNTFCMQQNDSLEQSLQSKDFKANTDNKTPPSKGRSPTNTSDSSTLTSAHFPSNDTPPGYGGFAPLKPWLSHSGNVTLSIFCILASFSTYFCVYAFRKAVFAHSYEFVGGWFGSGMSFKTAISLMQTLGLTISKITGIKYHFDWF
jgi:hypothetical protein